MLPKLNPHFPVDVITIKLLLLLFFFIFFRVVAIIIIFIISPNAPLKNK